MSKPWDNSPQLRSDHPSAGKKDPATGRITPAGNMEVKIRKVDHKGAKVSTLSRKRMETGT
jgi:hypothetical protein